MVAKVLDGEVVAARVRASVAHQVKELADRGVSVGLGTILVGDDPSSSRYVEMKHRDCQEVGMVPIHRYLPTDATTRDVIAVVHEFNDDPRVSAFLIQLPLPRQIDEEAVLMSADPRKDVDGLHPMNLGFLAMGKPKVIPCTPAGIVELLGYYGVELEGRHLVVLGRGLTIGRPLALLGALNEKGFNAAVTVLHSRVPDLAPLARTADILVSAVGHPGLITKEMVAPGAAVVGAGTSFEGRRLLSDIDEDVAEVAGWLTPRIGGVGPMTRAKLLENAVAAALAFNAR